MRTEQDKINRKEANQRYYKLEENKEQKREYMRKYNNRNKKTIYLHHEQWAQENGYRENDRLNSKNTTRFKDDSER
jgi:predicted ATPase